jgi:hypothetical protein
MATRLDLQLKLEELLGSRNVYYRPPSNIRMQYDPIRYSDKKGASRFADDIRYSHMNCYELIVIAKLPGHPVIDKLLALPYCSWDRGYVADNLNHDVFTLYY